MADKGIPMSWNKTTQEAYNRNGERFEGDLTGEE